MANVKVFYFETYDFDKDQIVRSVRPATEAFIDRYRFVRVEDDAREVDSSDIDAFGLLAGDS